MKKVAIITITDNNNYGNRLQNYAVIKILKKYNLEVNTIWEKKKNITKLKKLMKKILGKMGCTKYRRENKFEEFTRDYTYPVFLDYNTDLDKIYDYFVIGSDQIFNLKWQLYRLEFLKNINKEKNIAFAASFGVNNIQTNYTDHYKDIINNINCLSVREERGREIIKNLKCKNNVEVLIDPTMLITEKEWNKLVKTPQNMTNKKYILNYFLGDLSENRKKEIERIARTNGCEVINILDKNSPYFTCNPQEFLYLEKNAFLICTDSFHSSVFAILYNRPFVVFEREDKEEKMNARIETLISKFKLKNRQYNGKNITNENLEHDYTEAYKILENERRKSDMFLLKALNIKE